MIYTDEVKAAWKKLFVEANTRLIERKKEMETPPLPYMPTDDDIMVYRMPPPKKKERTVSGLVIPQGYWTKPEPGRPSEWIDVIETGTRPLGLLMALGCVSLDWAMTHGILPGDIVCFGEWEGRERSFEYDESDRATQEDKLRKILQMGHSGIRGSVDLLDRLFGEKPTMRVVPVFTDDGVVNLVEPIPENIL